LAPGHQLDWTNKQQAIPDFSSLWFHLKATSTGLNKLATGKTRINNMFLLHKTNITWTEWIDNMSIICFCFQNKSKNILLTCYWFIQSRWCLFWKQKHIIDMLLIHSVQVMFVLGSKNILLTCYWFIQSRWRLFWKQKHIIPKTNVTWTEWIDNMSIICFWFPKQTSPGLNESITCQ
jgi:hypothetical protein